LRKGEGKKKGLQKIVERYWGIVHKEGKEKGHKPELRGGRKKKCQTWQREKKKTHGNRKGRGLVHRSAKGKRIRILKKVKKKRFGRKG